MSEHMRKSFRATDPDFAFIAANAAAEVDNLIHGREAMLENVSMLSKIIGGSIAYEGAQGKTIKNLMDPVTTDVFSRSFTASYKDSVNSLDDLAIKVERLSKELQSVDDKKEKLEVLRDFCVALSKNALATRRTLHESRMRNPYKK